MAHRGSVACGARSHAGTYTPTSAAARLPDWLKKKERSVRLATWERNGDERLEKVGDKVLGRGGVVGVRDVHVSARKGVCLRTLA